MRIGVSIDEATRRHYAKLYARPGAMHAAFNQFAAFGQDAIDNRAFAEKGKLAMPILALQNDTPWTLGKPTSCLGRDRACALVRWS